MSYIATNQPSNYNGQSSMAIHSQNHGNWNERLDQAVADGQLTSAQEAMIESKYRSMHQSLGSMRNMSDSQRHSDMQQMRSQMQSWAQSEGIPSQFMMGNHS
ncbi:MAG TPA: hypothetical protein VMS08_02305 [Candidatus Saccharimonadia bacterium]|nr:hypothetical protein [Candidatus Saccharimonadia bacterium]